MRFMSPFCTESREVQTKRNDWFRSHGYLLAKQRISWRASLCQAALPCLI